MSGTVVPRAKSLEDIYPLASVDSQRARWQSLLAKFESLYGHAPTFVARSPGRVNIIGEHIDYSLYSVLPMAIEADVLMAVSTTDSDPEEGSDSYCIQIANVQEDRFPARDFSLPHGGAVEIDDKVHEWSNYFRCGLRAALELLHKKRGGDPAFRAKSMRVLMDGAVPPGGGLSSSAAFTTTAALAVMTANGEAEVDKKELTELAIVSERAVGVNSGGMDQSASVFAQRGSALFVTFSPTLTARPVSIPHTNPELCFVIAQSFVKADKFVTGPIHYNLRVVECTLAAAYLNAVLNPPGTELPTDASPLGISLHGFHETYFALREAAGDQDVPTSAPKQLALLLALTRASLPKDEGYTREEVAAALGISVDELDTRFTSRFPVRADRFLLRQRAEHVFSEALRVIEFMSLLERDPSSLAGSHGTTGGETLVYNALLGAKLDATQASCRNLYNCSCPELEDLCAIARRAGSYGSRLTGAGWGGCSVHLVPADKVAEVTEAWEREYYSKRELTQEQKDAAVVVSLPGNGSAVLFVGEGRIVEHFKVVGVV